MKTPRKVILTTLLACLLACVALAGAVLYVSAHPVVMKEMVEGCLSRVLGSPVAMKHLSYGLRPLRIGIEGLTVGAEPTDDGLHLRIPRLEGFFSIEGPFGRRSLKVERLHVSGMSCHIPREAGFPGTGRGPKRPPLIRSAFETAFAFLAFRDIRVEGLTIDGDVTMVDKGGPWLSLEGIEARLNGGQRIAIRCNAQLRWPSKGIVAATPLRIHSLGAVSFSPLRVRCDVSLDHLLLQSPVADIKDARGGMRLSCRSEAGQVTFEDIHLVVKEALVTQGGRKAPVSTNLSVRAAGVFDWQGGRVHAEFLDLSMGEHLQAAGEIKGGLSDPRGIHIIIRECRLAPRDMVPLLPLDIRRQIAPVAVEGPLHIRGTVEVVQDGTGWKWRPDMEVRLDRSPFAVTRASAKLKGKLTGAMNIRGEAPDVSIRTDLTANEVNFEGSGVEVGAFEASISTSGVYPLLTVKKASMDIPHMIIPSRGGPIRVGDIRVRAEGGSVNVRDKSGVLRGVRIDSSLLKNLVLSLELGPREVNSLGIQGTETGLPSMAVGLRFLPAGWRMTGRDRITAHLRKGEGAQTVMAAEWTIEDLEFQSPDGRIGGEKVSLMASLKGRWDARNRVADGDLSLEANAGGILFDRYYKDLKRSPFRLAGGGSYHEARQAVRLSNLTLCLENILACRLEGSIGKRKERWEWDLAAAVPQVPLRPLFELLAMEPFQTEKPFLRSLQVEGSVSSNVRLRADASGWAAKGLLHWKEGGISAPDTGLLLKEIDLSLPLWVQAAGRETGPSAKLEGRLSVRLAGIPFLPEQTLTFPLKAGPNRLWVPSPTVVKASSGDIRVGPIRIEARPGMPFAASTDLALNRLDIGPILSRFWPRPLEGTIAGRMDPVKIEAGRLTSRGKITAAVFGGEIRVSGFGVDGILAGTPVLRLDADWTDLNLSEITADTPFGRIDGFLRGYVKGLEMARGEVQRFDLLMETVPREKGSQRISITAVDNIARIGGGNSPFVGMAGVFASAFREFPYEKIGIHATLENDMFRINGTIREGGTEYLVKRGLFSGVNVINKNPDNRVGFKDMMKRIERIQSSKGGPEIR